MEDFDVEIYLRSKKMARIKYRKGKEFWIEQYEDFPFCFSPQEPLIEDVRKFFYGRVPTGIIVPEDELVAYMKKSGGRLFMDRIKLKFRKVRETKDEKM